MVRLRNTGEDVHVYAPPGHEDSLLVASGQVVEVAGDLAAEQVDDAIVVDSQGERRAWPRSRWEIVQDAPAKPAASGKGAQE